MPALPRVRDERGFTLIEVLVTMTLLVVGIGGTLALIDGANARTVATKEREAGNALTREVIEAARSVPYRQLTPNNAVATLKAIPGLEDTTPVDDGMDRGAAQPDVHDLPLGCARWTTSRTAMATPAAAASAPEAPAGPDRNPDDYKRITVDVSWKRGVVTRNIRQAGIVSNDASSAGPSVEFTSPARERRRDHLDQRPR